MVDSIVVGAIATNCWIYSSKGFCALIDPGAEAAAIIARLKRHKLQPSHILLTHGHFDHVAALGPLLETYSNPAPILAIHASDAAYLGRGALEKHRRDFAYVGAGSYVDELWTDLPEATRILEEGDHIGPLRILHLPGHSPGSVAFYNQEEGLLFSGDTLFAQGVGRTDLPGGDAEKLRKSLERLFLLEDNTKVLPGHGNKTTIAAERHWVL